MEQEETQVTKRRGWSKGWQGVGGMKGGIPLAPATLRPGGSRRKRSTLSTPSCCSPDKGQSCGSHVGHVTVVGGCSLGQEQIFHFLTSCPSSARNHGVA